MMLQGLKSGKANILTRAQFDYLLRIVQARARSAHHALRDFTILLFSYKGALRSCEIAGLRWTDVMDPTGAIGKPYFNPETGETDYFFEVPNAIAKKGRGRLVPMHDTLRATLEHLQRERGPARSGPKHPIIQHVPWRRAEPEEPTGLTPHALVLYLLEVYEHAGLQGCSSHSGRRTAITTLARTHAEHACSLIDVQKYAGHANLADTEVYIEASPYTARMVRSL
jgi:integrase/recombinase XerD